MSDDYSLIHVLSTLARWKKQIFIATGLVAAMSVIGSLMMPTYYQSTTLLYAASPTLANPDLVGGIEKTYKIYGSGEDLDRLFSIANSAEVKHHLINKYNLAKHYDINVSNPKGKAKLARKISKLYETTKTKFDGLLLSIEDTDRNQARDMVKSAREFIENKAQNIIKESQANQLSALADGIKVKESQLKITGDTLTKLKNKYGIYESYAQAKAFAELATNTESNLIGKESMLNELKKYANVPIDSINKLKAKIAGVKSMKIGLENRIKLFNEGVLSVRQIEVGQTQMVEELALAKERYKNLKSSYDKSFTSIHIVEKETIPNEKSRPKRSIIVIGLSLLAFVLSCLVALLIQSAKTINWREVYAGK
ncbi:MAG: hypothetical protein V3V14_02655 [Saprospiraceae bacterium]